MIRGRALAVGIVAAALAALASLAPVAPVVPTCAGAGAHHAALVVEHGDGSVVSRCVAFDTSEISGEQLLTLSGIGWSGQTFGGFGEAVCALDGEPARYVDCPGKDSYWAVFLASGGGSWRLSNVGISSEVLRDGDAEGFRYVPAAGSPAAPAPPLGVCPAAPAASSRPAATPVATPSATVSPAQSAPSAEPARATTPPIPGVSGSSPSSDASAVRTGVALSAGPGKPPPAAPSGPDPGFLAASVAGGALAGLALLRLIARKRQPR